MSVVEPEPVLSFREPHNLSARGTVVVVPGRGERPDVYRRFGERLSFDAYRVHIVGDPTAGADQVRRQLERVITADAATSPLVLAGSDSGALFAAGLLARGGLERVDGLLLAGLPVATDPIQATTWEEELDARTTCPTHRGRISESLVAPGALYQALPQEWIDLATLESVDRPVLALHGRDDQISRFESARELYAGAELVELVGIAGARHDVLNDQSHRTVAATVVLWLERLRLGDGLAPIALPERIGVNVA